MRQRHLKLSQLEHGEYYYGGAKVKGAAVARWDNIKKLFFFWKWRETGNTVESLEYGREFAPYSVIKDCKEIPLENEK